MIGNMNASGSLAIKKIGKPNPKLYQLQNRLRLLFLWGWLQVQIAKTVNRLFGVSVIHSELRAVLTHAGQAYDLGVLSYRVVTTAFVNFVVDQLQTDTTEIGDFKYHDSGVGATAENAADTGIETTDGESRATGTQTESAANAYRSVGTISYTTTKAITEHGLFSSASSTTLMDRSVFSAINVVSGDSIQFTYTITFSSGG